MTYVPENPGNSVKPEWVMRELSRVSSAIDLAAEVKANNWTAAAQKNAGDGTIHGDVNATTWTGHQHAIDTCLQITESDTVTFTNGFGISYLWVGPKPVLLGPGCGYTAAATDFEALTTNDHSLLAGRDRPSQHPQSAITGLENRLNADETALFNHKGDQTNPHQVTAAQAGAAPTVHNHVEADIIDLNRVRAKGRWVAQTYLVNDMVEHDGYMGVCIADTTDPLAPAPVGSPAWLLSDNPTWSNQSQDAAVNSGLRISGLTEAKRITTARVWIPSVDPDHLYQLQILDNVSGQSTFGVQFAGDSVGAPGWKTLTITPVFMYPGDDVSFILNSTSLAGPMPYVRLPGWNILNASIVGVLQFDGISQPNVEDDMFGVDVEIQTFALSPDWLIYSTPGGGYSTGGGGGPATPVDNDPVGGNTAFAISSDWAFQHAMGAKSRHGAGGIDYDNATGMVATNVQAAIDELFASPETDYEVSDTPPANPKSGDGWLDSKTGIPAIWYVDQDQGQWVSAPYEAVGGVELNAMVIVSDTPPVGIEGLRWLDSKTGWIATYYDDGASKQWISATPEFIEA